MTFLSLSPFPLTVHPMELLFQELLNSWKIYKNKRTRWGLFGGDSDNKKEKVTRISFFSLSIPTTVRLVFAPSVVLADFRLSGESKGKEKSEDFIR